MDLNFSVYSVSLLLAGGITGVIFMVTFINSERAVKSFALMMAGVTIWALAYAVELTMSSVDDMMFWVRVEYIGIALMPAFWLIFCLQYTNVGFGLNKKRLALIFALPLATLLMVWTNDWHHLHYNSISIAREGDLFFLNIDIGVWYIIHTVVFYAYLLLGIIVLIREYRMANKMIKKQVAFILVGACIPWIANMMYLMEMVPFSYLDITPYAFAITGVIISIGLIRFKLFKILPIAQKQIIEQMSEGVLILDKEYNILDVNPAMEKLLGNINTDGSDRSIFSISDGEHSLRDLLHLKKEAVLEFEKDINGQLHYFEVNLKPFVDKMGTMTGYFLVFRDITHRKKREGQIIKAKKEADAANRAKSDFLAHMSHEIRTPLNGIIGFVDMLTRTELNDTQQQYMSTVQSSADSLLDIINEILDLSKIEAGRLELNPERTDVLALCSQTIEMFSWQVRQKNVKMTLNIYNSIPQFIFVDLVRLRQVLINLLGNALKFTEEGTIELRVESTDQTDESPRNIRFSIQDTGIGIAPGNQQKIFEAFAQEDASTTKKFGGTGLGLTISNSLLELMGCRLQLRSTPGAGSTFYFDLPVKVIGDEVNLEKERQPVLAKGSKSEEVESTGMLKQPCMHVFTILVAEDSVVNMQLVIAIMKQNFPKATISKATDGKEAVEYFKNQVPDIVFMDIQMPKLNGYEAATQIRDLENGNRTPIIALTAGSILEEQEKCFKAGMDDFISKPVLPETLKKVILKWVDLNTTSP